MEKTEIDDFINSNALHLFDGLVEIILKDQTTYRGVWITTLPPLDRSIDGKFEGKPEAEVFYLFEQDQYVVWAADEILGLKCLQQGYLLGLPYQFSKM